MPTLTIKNIPEALYSRLKRRATDERRSMNNQAIDCLERALQLPSIDVERVLARTRTIRRKTTGLPLTDKLLARAKSDGRP